MYKERAINIIQAALYSDPMMDEVVLVKEILGILPKEDAILLLAVASGVPIKVFRSFYSYKISEIVRDAADNFVENLERVYASQE